MAPPLGVIACIGEATALSRTDETNQDARTDVLRRRARAAVTRMHCVVGELSEGLREASVFPADWQLVVAIRNPDSADGSEIDRWRLRVMERVTQ